MICTNQLPEAKQIEIHHKNNFLEQSKRLLEATQREINERKRVEAAEGSPPGTALALIHQTVYLLRMIRIAYVLGVIDYPIMAFD